MPVRNAARRILAPAFAVPLAALVATAGAQQRTIIRDAPSCATCRVDARLIATLGAPSDSGTLGLHSSVVRDSRGVFYAIVEEPGMVAVYDATGRFLRTVGRRGEGPGEFRSVSTIAVDAGDSLYVFGARISVFSPTGRFVRTRAIPGSFQVRAAAILPVGAVLMQGMMNSRGKIGMPFHILRPGEDTVASFGGAPSERFVWNVYDASRRIAVRDNATFLAARLPRYQLEQWTFDGKLTRVMERQADWFVAWQWDPQRPDDARVAKPNPHIAGLALDANGVAWVATQVADAKWTAAPPSEKPISAAEYARAIDTMVEAIDVNTGRLRASRRFDGPLWMTGANLGLEYVEDRDGFTRIRAWELRVTNN